MRKKTSWCVHDVIGRLRTAESWRVTNVNVRTRERANDLTNRYQAGERRLILLPV